MESQGETSQPQENQILKPKPPKEREPGIIYLSRIPPSMSVKKIRQIFSMYGETDKIFLQPDDKATGKKKNRLFTEGWIEFLDKRIAKRVVTSLNNTQIGGRRKNPWYEDIWTMKYLPKFKWGHLNERLAYERAVHKQRLRTEIAQAKKESNFYIQNVHKGTVQKRKETRKQKQKQRGDAAVDGGENLGNNNDDAEERRWSFRQRETEDDILARKNNETASGPHGKRKSSLETTNELEKTKRAKRAGDDGGKKAATNKDFLKRIFSGGLPSEKEDDNDDDGGS